MIALKYNYMTQSKHSSSAFLVFKCLTCGYSAQVQGELYIDRGSYGFMQTKVCRNCNVLFEDMYDIPLTIGVILKRHDLLNLMKSLDMEYSGKSSGCLRCGENNSEVWSKDKPRCPKCGKLMTRKFDGRIIEQES